MDNGINCEPGITSQFSDQRGFYPWGKRISMVICCSILGLSSLIYRMGPQSFPCYLLNLTWLELYFGSSSVVLREREGACRSSWAWEGNRQQRHLGERAAGQEATLPGQVTEPAGTWQQPRGGGYRSNRPLSWCSSSWFSWEGFVPECVIVGSVSMRVSVCGCLARESYLGRVSRL